MPNECDNSLSVSGPQDEVDRFKRDARSYDGYNGCCEEGRSNQLDINNFIPMPVELKERTSPEQDPRMAAIFKEKYGAEDWYMWAIDNWGTKWGAYDTFVKEINQENTTEKIPALIRYEFTTAWGPLSDDAMREVSRQYPKLSFELFYDEPMMDIHGEANYENGKMIYHTNREEEWIDETRYVKSTNLDIIPTERNEQWLPAQDALDT